MKILTFLLENWDSAALIAILAAGVVSLVVRGETNLLKELLFRVVTELEKQYGVGTGVLKKAAALEWLYDKLPAVIRVIAPKAWLDKLVEDALTAAKAKWTANKKLLEVSANDV